MKTKKLTKSDFDWVNWKPNHISKITNELLGKKVKLNEKIKAIPAAEKNFENTVIALEKSGDEISDFSATCTLLKAVSRSKLVRDACEANLVILTQKLIEIEFDRDLYKAVKIAAKKVPTVPEDKKLLKEIIDAYRRMGLDLPEKQFKKLKANLGKLSELATKFDTTLAEWEDHILVSKESLENLPDSYIKGLTKEKGKFKISLAYPDSVPFMQFSSDSKARKELAVKLAKKGGSKNLKLLTQMIDLRKQNTKLLGYKSFVDLTVENRTAKNARTIENFLKSLRQKVQSEAKADLKRLTKLKQKLTTDKKAKLEHFDIAYFAQIEKKEIYGIDGNIIKEYLLFEQVRDVTLDIYQHLLGVTFKPVNFPTWDKSVAWYQIQDAASKEIIAYFALDLHPRKGKYGHAAAFEVRESRVTAGEHIPPVGVMVANFPKSSAKVPALMSHSDVETFFHEFGHIMHLTLSRTTYASQSSFRVAWDFVEMPSQMLENWVWNEDVLAKMLKHYKTGKTLPKDILQNLIASRLHLEKYAVMRQITLALFDLEVHTKKISNVHLHWSQMVKNNFNVETPKENLFPASFAHIAHGYEAGYYSYLWARVFAEDMFSKFDKDGLLNSKTGKQYRKKVLEPGASVDELTLVKNFLGRKPNNKAFLRSIGIK